MLVRRVPSETRVDIRNTESVQLTLEFSIQIPHDILLIFCCHFSLFTCFTIILFINSKCYELMPSTSVNGIHTLPGWKLKACRCGDIKFCASHM